MLGFSLETLAILAAISMLAMFLGLVIGVAWLAKRWSRRLPQAILGIGVFWALFWLASLGFLEVPLIDPHGDLMDR